jgi:transcriptional regulator with XRE-family HTH domain
MDLHRPTISEIEAGRRSVKAEEISRFADLYDVRRDWIVGGESVLPGENDPRIELAARELRRLKPKDLDAILRLIQILRTPRSRA